MKKIALIFTLLFSAFSFADETTQERLIDDIHISTTGTYYFKSKQGWGAPGCPNATYIFIRKNQAPASEAILSLVLSSQAQNRTIYARGNCTDSKHFQLNYLVQGQK